MSSQAATAVAAPVLTARGLEAGYGDRIVVRRVDLDVRPGEVVGLFGPNGAGKSTLLSTLAGLNPVKGGTLELFGRVQPSSVRPHRRAAEGLCLVPEGRGLFRTLSVEENLRLSRSIRRTGLDSDTVLEAFPALAPLRRRKAGSLSGGEQQMLVLARALLTGPTLLLIDEMSMGLAPMVAENLLELVQGQARRHEIAVIVVEQHVPLALRFVDRGYLLAHGSIVRSGSAAELAGDEQLLQSTYFGTSGAPT